MTARVRPFEDFADSNGIELRLAPIDVGFDIRTLGYETLISRDRTVASYADAEGKVLVVEGTAMEIVETLRASGYICDLDDDEETAALGETAG